MLSTSEVIDLSGLPLATLTAWVSQGIITPAEVGGPGRGRGHRFSLMQAVGIVVAARVHQSPRSCAPSYVGLIVETFGAKTEGWLLEQFKDKPGHHGPLTYF